MSRGFDQLGGIVDAFCISQAIATEMGMLMSRGKDMLPSTAGTFIGKNIFLNCIIRGVRIAPRSTKMDIMWGMIRELHVLSWRCTLRFLESLVCKIRNYRNDSRHQGPSMWNCGQQLRKMLRQHSRKQWKLKGKFILPKICRTELLLWVALLNGGMEAMCVVGEYKIGLWVCRGGN